MDGAAQVHRIVFIKYDAWIQFQYKQKGVKFVFQLLAFWEIDVFLTSMFLTDY